jgi:ribosome-binding factor A
MSHRIPQLNELLRQEISELFLREMTWPENALVTITKVTTAHDLSQTKVMISVLPVNEQERVLKILNNKARHIQHLLGQKLVIRKIPKIIFRFDDTEEKASHIEGLIDRIHHQG